MRTLIQKSSYYIVYSRLYESDVFAQGKEALHAKRQRSLIKQSSCDLKNRERFPSEKRSKQTHQHFH